MSNETIDEINAAADADALFPPIRKRAINKYRRLMRAVHPDVDPSPEATAAAARLNALWEDWLTAHDGKPGSTAAAPKPTTKPTEVLRTESSVLFTTPGGWLSVTRSAGGPNGGDIGRLVKKLNRLVSGSPVDVGGRVSPVMIPQADGLHSAVRVERGLMDDGWTLGALGKLTGRDAAWVLKRLVFLGGALETAGLDVPELGRRVVVQPSKHMVGLFDFTGAVGRSNVDAMTPLMAEFIERCADESETDGRKLAAFAKGSMLKSRPAPVELMRELDDVLFDLYGKPQYHAMPDPVGH
ncbi:hypothetical protein KIH75_05870 [Bifidobacterium sp. 64T4]|uniref:hypothetical protein n=1 Tax=Bifidobacterium pongonis TaxID=2834432 RepID=UPI001C595575|nr:hypothetical protein [Bifidobacterium pongonis]MBW3094867.1 hypothetical protein [Bifidobacterium pongonis]